MRGGRLRREQQVEHVRKQVSIRPDSRETCGDYALAGRICPLSRMSQGTHGQQTKFRQNALLLFAASRIAFGAWTRSTLAYVRAALNRLRRTRQSTHVPVFNREALPVKPLGTCRPGRCSPTAHGVITELVPKPARPTPTRTALCRRKT